MIYVYSCVVGIIAPESLCYLLMYINPTLNKDYLLTLKRLIAQTFLYYQNRAGRFSGYGL
jgi:hypothetical protein